MESTNINNILRQAEASFEISKLLSGRQKAAFLRAIAEEIEAISEAVAVQAQRESNLPEARIKGEIGRTTGQLRSFASLLEAGHWVQATIDTADTDRKPLAKPDIRKMFFPIGPVIVFGASNFPLAFSTAGGDTASALAAGCSVIVKSHPAHPRTSALVAEAISKASRKTNMPEFIFQHIEDGSIETGQQLVHHPATKAVAFTGSYQGGKALFDLAARRKEPIPVFAEMGSVNPVVVLPDYSANNSSLGEMLAASVLQGVGQFCTNPGLIITIDSPSFDSFRDTFAKAIAQSTPAKMLHKGIAGNYREKKSISLVQKNVSVLAAVDDLSDDISASASLAMVNAEDFIANPQLHEEVFGPFSLIVKCKDQAQMENVVGALHGQLTASVFASDKDCSDFYKTISSLQQRVGRLIFNGVPTGVEVCKAMHHGGPFPATTDSRFTSVGNDAIYRFVRPVSFQNAPATFLPPELLNENPLNILRCINNEWTSAKVSLK